MAAVAVDHDRHLPAAILSPHQAKERLKIVGTLPSSSQKQPILDCFERATDEIDMAPKSIWRQSKRITGK